VITPLSAEGFGTQLKQAVKNGARFAVLLGDEELKSQKVVVKNLEKNSQEVVAITEVSAFIRGASSS
jgi:histidyl-tRNA synthetase